MHVSGEEHSSDRRRLRYSDELERLETASVARRNNGVRVMVFVLLAVFIILLLIDSFRGHRVKGAIISFLGWVERNPFYGVFAVIIVFAFATVLFVPASILTIGCGFAFGAAFGIGKGVALASTAVFLGASLGSILSFLLGRYLFRDWVTQMTTRYAIFQAIDQAMQGNGLKIMVLLRLSPLIPFNALDYMSGLTAIPLSSYSLALLGMLPGVIVFTFFGASASSLADSETRSSQNKTVKYITISVGVVFALVGVMVASFYSKKELDKILEGSQAEDQEAGPAFTEGRLEGTIQISPYIT